MNEENRCPQCGVTLPANSPQGLCPGCLLKRGLDTYTYTGENQDDRPSQPECPPPTPEELAELFPDLEILELVGRGGMGVVYKARQKRLERLVALKILSPRLSQDQAFAERFAREARAMAMLNHPQVVAVHDFGEVDGLYYFLMEFVDGVNLRRLLDAGKLAPEEALAIVPQICDALQYAHDHGVVHRDIKPENVLMDQEGRVKIADFGIAKLVGVDDPNRPAAEDAVVHGSSDDLTAAGQVLGTPQYMAPEQIERPLEVDHRADIYSLGVVFYQMLTGELPKDSITRPSQKVHIDVRLDEVVLRAMEKEPQRRYQQANDVKTQVENITSTACTFAESAEPSASQDGLPKTSSCYISSPEHLRSIRGRYINIYKGKGELRLDSETLTFTSDWPTVVIPLSSIRRIARGDYPYTAKPLPIPYIEITFEEHGAERTLLFTPFSKTLTFPKEANQLASEWLSTLLEAVRVCTGRTFEVEASQVKQDKFWLLKSAIVSIALLAIFASIPIIFMQGLLPSGGFDSRITNIFLGGGIAFLFISLLGWAYRSSLKRKDGNALAEHGGAAETDVKDSEIEAARRQVKGPAIGLFIVGILICLVLPLISMLINMEMASHSHGVTSGPNMSMVLFFPVVFFPGVLMFIPGVLMIIAAVKMKRLQAYSLAMLASILAILTSPAFCFLGLPIGIWALVVLSQKEVRRTFGAQKISSEPTWRPPESGWGWLVGRIFGFTFTSRFAYRCADLSALGFLGLFGLVPYPGWQVCFWLFGLFGLIGLAYIVEIFARPNLAGPKMVITITALSMAVGMLVVFTLGILLSPPSPQVWESTGKSRDSGIHRVSIQENTAMIEGKASEGSTVTFSFSKVPYETISIKKHGRFTLKAARRTASGQTFFKVYESNGVMLDSSWGSRLKQIALGGDFLKSLPDGAVQIGQVEDKNGEPWPLTVRVSTLQPPPASDLKKVDFVIDSRSFEEGDNIEIKEVLSELGTLAKGDTVTVRGTYTLKSRPTAELVFHVAAGSDGSPILPPIGPSNRMDIFAGSDSFELKHSISRNGNLRLSFYPIPGSRSFGEVYFSAKSTPKEKKQGTENTQRKNPDTQAKEKTDKHPSPANSGNPKTGAATSTAGMTSLADAVRKFNARAKLDDIGKDQSPLTEDEVVAAIRRSLLEPEKLPISDKTLQRLKKIPVSRQLPPDFELDVFTSITLNGSLEFSTWSVCLRIPAETQERMTRVNIRK